ncbi:hypothetical protein QLX08_003794 [Tetragonisca angustula]|uniref:Uncharacterized protein n=1 Tax=Tetragonisca angustula TaxID=166442 RepID=A0AAW1A508_9HYME
MGNWQMEIGRMMSYILFPIGIYYYFNQSENIEEWIQNEKKKFNTLTQEEHNELVNFIEEYNKKREIRRITEMETQYNEVN